MKEDQPKTPLYSLIFDFMSLTVLLTKFFYVYIGVNIHVCIYLWIIDKKDTRSVTQLVKDI